MIFIPVCEKTESFSWEKRINETTARLIVAQLLFLESEDPGKDIQLYINSPGGVVSCGLGNL